MIRKVELLVVNNTCYKVGDYLIISTSRYDTRHGTLVSFTRDLLVIETKFGEFHFNYDEIYAINGDIIEKEEN